MFLPLQEKVLKQFGNHLINLKMSSNPRVPWQIEPLRPLERTINLIEFTLTVLTDLIQKFDQHTQMDKWDVIIYILRQISDIQFQLFMQS